jgi:hypothetical protein
VPPSLAARVLLMLFVLPCGVTASGQADAPSSQITATREVITFDPRTCTEGTAYISTGVQGARVNVLGRKGGSCAFEYVTDGCGGCFAHYRCAVPVDSGPVRVWVENGSIKTSLKPGQMKLVRTTGPAVTVLVGDTGEYVWHNNSQRASDMAPAKGDRVRFRFRLYATEEFKNHLQGAHFDPRVEFEWGAGQAWPWLEAASEGMTVGERRHVRVPTSIAAGAKEWLPKSYAGTTLFVEAALVNLERAKGKQATPFPWARRRGTLGRK